MNYWEGKLHYKTGGVGCPVEEMDFSSLKGAVIMDAGFHPSSREGGFTIDYRKDGKKKRIVLGFNELGLWKEWEGELEKPNKLDLLIKKIRAIFNSNNTIYWFSIKEDEMKKCYHLKIGKKKFLTISRKDLESMGIVACFSIPDKIERESAILMALSSL